jgi:hypothetical protein
LVDGKAVNQPPLIKNEKTCHSERSEESQIFSRTPVIMNIIEKRDYIHSHLHQVNDNILDELFEKVASYFKESPADIDLSPELKDALTKGIESLEKGKSSSHHEVMERMKKKYPKLIK